MNIVDRKDVGEVAGLLDGRGYHRERHQQKHIEEVPWNMKGLYVSRLRLLSDPGFPVWDVSYCHGILDGKHVDIFLPFSQLKKKNIKGQIIQFAKSEKIFAKGLGILDNISTLC